MIPIHGQYANALKTSQAASVARVAAAFGYHVRAHVHQLSHSIAIELSNLENVTILEGTLEDQRLLAKIFDGAQKAFINTVSFGDEVTIGKALANAAKKAGIQHYIYSSMPDHSIYGKWPALPLWSVKFTVENYIRQASSIIASSMTMLMLIAPQIGLPATFVYTGIYNNNFTSLPYPLFCMKIQPNGSFVWKAPFDIDRPIPWLDAEHDVGPAVLQIFKDGVRKWKLQRLVLMLQLHPYLISL